MERKNEKSENAKMDSQAGENSSMSNPAAETINHNEKVYYVHPIYNNYAASEDGYIINRKKLISKRGYLKQNGYFQIWVTSKNGKRNKCYSHRMVFEAINQK